DCRSIYLYHLVPVPEVRVRFRDRAHTVCAAADRCGVSDPGAPARRGRGGVTMPKFASRVLWYVLFAVVIILALAPVVWMISTAFKPEREIISTELHWIPDQVTSEHFTAILQNYPMTQWLFNSLFTATAATLLVLVLDSLAGYAFARMRFRGRGVLFMIVLSMLFVPIQITIIPLFIMFSRLSLTDTYW